MTWAVGLSSATISAESAGLPTTTANAGSASAGRPAAYEANCGARSLHGWQCGEKKATIESSTRSSTETGAPVTDSAVNGATFSPAASTPWSEPCAAPDDRE